MVFPFSLSLPSWPPPSTATPLSSEAERKRLAELEALAKREDAAWEEVEILLKKYTARNHEQAVMLISRLREVAVYKKMEALFQTRLNGIYERYRTRLAFLDRLRTTGLFPT